MLVPALCCLLLFCVRWLPCYNALLASALLFRPGTTLHYMAVTCVLAQKMGGGLTVGSAACWEPSTDGCMVERWENQSILALLVLFACSM